MFFTPEVVPDLPGHCAVTGKSTDGAGFVHTGNILSGWDPNVQVSVEGLKLLVAELPDEVNPFASRQEYEALVERQAVMERANAALEAERTEAVERAEEAERRVNALKQAGFKQKREKAVA